MALPAEKDTPPRQRKIVSLLVSVDSRIVEEEGGDGSRGIPIETGGHVVGLTVREFGGGGADRSVRCLASLPAKKNCRPRCHRTCCADNYCRERVMGTGSPLDT